MKIAILCPTLFAFNGIDRVAAQQAMDLLQSGNDITIFAFSANMVPPPSVKLELIGMPQGFLRQRLYRLFFPLNLLKSAKWAPKLKGFEVIYSHEYPMNWLAYLAKRLYGVRYIYYNHHLNPPEAFPTFIERTYTRLRLLAEKWTIKKADFAISVSQSSRQQLKNETGLESQVIYNKIDTQRFRSDIDGSKVRGRYNLGQAPVILSVGRVSYRKGHHLLLEAFHLVKHRFPTARLLVVGKYDNDKYFKKLRRMADDSVIFTGDVPDEDLVYYYAACDVYATATLWEGFNLPLAEAQLCGKQVVAFNVGPHPEIVRDNAGGALVTARDTRALADAICAALLAHEITEQQTG